jgi:hypothetical protein
LGGGIDHHILSSATLASMLILLDDTDSGVALEACEFWCELALRATNGERTLVIVEGLLRDVLPRILRCIAYSGREIAVLDEKRRESIKQEWIHANNSVGASITVTVINAFGQETPVKVPADGTVADVKLTFEKQSGVHFNAQQLYRTTGEQDQDQLRSQSTLGEAGVMDGTVLVLIVGDVKAKSQRDGKGNVGGIKDDAVAQDNGLLASDDDDDGYGGRGDELDEVSCGVVQFDCSPDGIEYTRRNCKLRRA